MLIPLLVVPSALAAPRPATSAEVEAALVEVTRDPVLGEITTAIVSRQLQEQGPLALTDGFWVVPIDTGAIVADERVGAAVREELALDGLDLPSALDREGFAFLPADAVRDFGLAWDFDHYTDLAEATLGQQIDDFWQYVVGVAVVAGGSYVIDFIIGEVSAAGHRAGYFQSRNDLRTMSDPSLDSDNDGKNNRDDPDDDNDGTADEVDEYPFDAGKQICDLCGRTAIVGLGDTVDTLIFTDAVDSDLFTTVLLESIAEYSVTRGESVALLPLP